MRLLLRVMDSLRLAMCAVLARRMVDIVCRTGAQDARGRQATGERVCPTRRHDRVSRPVHEQESRIIDVEACENDSRTGCGEQEEEEEP